MLPWADQCVPLPTGSSSPYLLYVGLKSAAIAGDVEDGLKHFTQKHGSIFSPTIRRGWNPEDAMIAKIDGELRMEGSQCVSFAEHKWFALSGVPVLCCRYCGVLMSHLTRDHLEWYSNPTEGEKVPVWTTVKPQCLVEVEVLTS